MGEIKILKDTKSPTGFSDEYGNVVDEMGNPHEESVLEKTVDVLGNIENKIGYVPNKIGEFLIKPAIEQMKEHPVATAGGFGAAALTGGSSIPVQMITGALGAGAGEGLQQSGFLEKTPLIGSLLAPADKGEKPISNMIEQTVAGGLSPAIPAAIKGVSNKIMSASGLFKGVKGLSQKQTAEKILSPEMPLKISEKNMSDFLTDLKNSVPESKDLIKNWIGTENPTIEKFSKAITDMDVESKFLKAIESSKERYIKENLESKSTRKIFRSPIDVFVKKIKEKTIKDRMKELSSNIPQKSENISKELTPKILSLKNQFENYLANRPSMTEYRLNELAKIIKLSSEPARAVTYPYIPKIEESLADKIKKSLAEKK